jgi:capsular polysaccharide transport system permease protein
VAIIEKRIAAERRKFGADTDGTGRDYATLTGEYERLAADRDMAQASHMTALAAYDVVRSDAQRQSRYLAAYTAPTLAQSSTHPNRPMLIALIAAALTLAWSVITLTGYSMRDRY